MRSRLCLFLHSNEAGRFRKKIMFAQVMQYVYGGEKFGGSLFF